MIIEVESIQLLFDNLVYKSLDIYLNLTESSTHKPEMVNTKPNINVPHPKISIPQFNGHIDKWPEYHGLYEPLIHENLP